MNWAETVKANALALAAGRTATASRMMTDAPWSWNPHDVWLTRIGQPRKLATQPPKTDASTPPRQNTAPRG